MAKGYGLFFKSVRQLVRFVYPSYKAQISGEIAGPAVYVSHHRNLFGPFITLLWYPEFIRTWILHVFLDRKSCSRQYADYTFTKRFGFPRALANPAALFSVIRNHEAAEIRERHSRFPELAQNHPDVSGKRRSIKERGEHRHLSRY